MVILLDLDGTLVDTNYLHVDSWARAFRSVGVTVARRTIHRQIGKGSDQMLPLFLPERDKAERADAFHLEDVTRRGDEVQALPGARELLEHLRQTGHALWLATSAQANEIESRLKAIGAADELLTGIVSSADVERSKPAPDIFRAGCRQAGCRPEEAIVVGDTIWDLQAARGAGVRSVAVLSGGAFSRDELLAEGALAVYEDCAEMVATGFPARLPPSPLQ